MRLFPRLHTAESVAAELVSGLTDGSITLENPTMSYRTSMYTESFMNYAKFSHAELYDAAIAAGITFRLKTYLLELSTGPVNSTMLQVSLGFMTRPEVGVIDHEMRNRGEPFQTYVKERLRAAL